jgi:hypothetical protein
MGHEHRAVRQLQPWREASAVPHPPLDRIVEPASGDIHPQGNARGRLAHLQLGGLGGHARAVRQLAVSVNTCVLILGKEESPMPTPAPAAPRCGPAGSPRGRRAWGPPAPPRWG